MEGGEREGERGRKRKTIGGGGGWGWKKERGGGNEAPTCSFPLWKHFTENFYSKTLPSSRPYPRPRRVIKNLRNDKPFLSAHLTLNAWFWQDRPPVEEWEGEGLIKNGFRLNFVRWTSRENWVGRRMTEGLWSSGSLRFPDVWEGWYFNWIRFFFSFFWMRVAPLLFLRGK